MRLPLGSARIGLTSSNGSRCADPSCAGDNGLVADIPRNALTRSVKIAALPAAHAGRAAWGLGKRIGGKPAEMVTAELQARTAEQMFSVLGELKGAASEAGVMTAGGPTYPDGVNYGYALPNGAERSEENIAAWIVRGGRGQIGMMPGRRISEQELAGFVVVNFGAHWHAQLHVIAFGAEHV